MFSMAPSTGVSYTHQLHQPFHKSNQNAHIMQPDHPTFSPSLHGISLGTMSHATMPRRPSTSCRPSFQAHHAARLSRHDMPINRAGNRLYPTGKGEGQHGQPPRAQVRRGPRVASFLNIGWRKSTRIGQKTRSRRSGVQSRSLIDRDPEVDLSPAIEGLAWGRVASSLALSHGRLLGSSLVLKRSQAALLYSITDRKREASSNPSSIPSPIGHAAALCKWI
jgi:hypothetical protein